MDTLYKDLMAELECPVCTTHMIPPILQCQNGHSVCQNCRNRLKQCPICMGPFSDMRNFALEKMSSKMALPCRNKDQGCPLNLPLEERCNHEKVCQYKGVKCQKPGCSFMGKPEDLETHWNNKQACAKMYVDSYVCKNKLKPNSNFVNLVKNNEKYFWFRFRNANDQLSFVVQAVNKEIEYGTYFYEIEVYKPEMTRRRVVFSEYVATCDVSNALDSPFVSSLPVQMVKRFLDADETLVYRMSVKQVRMGPNKGAPGEARGLMSPFSNSTESLNSNSSSKPRNRPHKPNFHNKGPNSGPKGPPAGPKQGQKPNQGPRKPFKPKEKEGK